MTVVIDVYIFYLVVLGISNTMSEQLCKNVVEETIALHGKLEILNSDQGIQYSIALWFHYFEDQSIYLSIFNKGMVLNNV